MTLCPPGACPPERTTPTFKLWLGTAVDASPGTSIADGCPKRLGKSFLISSIDIIHGNEIIIIM